MLKDAYTGEDVPANSTSDLDHVMTAKEIHDDRGRSLAGLKGIENNTYNNTVLKNLMNVYGEVNRLLFESVILKYAGTHQVSLRRQDSVTLRSLIA